MSYRYSKIQSSIWNSEKFNSVDDFAQKVYLYLLSSPHGNSAGLYRLPFGYAITDLRCTEQKYKKAIHDLEDTELISTDFDLLLIHQFLRFNPYNNSKHARGSVEVVAEFVGSRLYSIFYLEVEKWCIPYIEEFTKPIYDIDTVSIPYTNSNDTVSAQRPRPKTNTNTNTKEKAPAGAGDIFAGHSFSPKVKAKLEEWMQYKTERREMYKPTGLKSFMTEVENRLKVHSETDVIDLISECMANNWRGIIWDKIKGRASPFPGRSDNLGSKPRHFAHPEENFDHLAVDLFENERGTG